MKYPAHRTGKEQPQSRPARGAWIEIERESGLEAGRICRAPARGAWIEISTFEHQAVAVAVAPPHGARGLK